MEFLLHLNLCYTVLSVWTDKHLYWFWVCLCMHHILRGTVCVCFQTEVTLKKILCVVLCVLTKKKVVYTKKEFLDTVAETK